MILKQKKEKKRKKEKTKCSQHCPLLWKFPTPYSLYFLTGIHKLFQVLWTLLFFPINIWTFRDRCRRSVKVFILTNRSHPLYLSSLIPETEHLKTPIAENGKRTPKQHLSPGQLRWSHCYLLPPLFLLLLSGLMFFPSTVFPHFWFIYPITYPSKPSLNFLPP